MTRRGRADKLISIMPTKYVQILTAMILVYIIFIGLEFPLFLNIGSASVSGERLKQLINGSLARKLGLQFDESKESINIQIPASFLVPPQPHFRNPKRKMGESNKVSGLSFNSSTFYDTRNVAPDMYKLAQHAWIEGMNRWEDLKSGKVDAPPHGEVNYNDSQICPDSIILSDSEFHSGGRMMVIPCGLTVGSHVTVVGKPRWAHYETDPKIAHLKDGDESLLVSQFMVELRGLKTVEGEEPPKILHFNPRLKGDWSGMPVIEQNTCYRMQWGSALRCQGWRSKENEETVDGQVKCEKWIRDDENYSEESETTWWLNRLIRHTQKVSVDWPYPFVEGKLFVLTLTAGLEGYHISVDGKHATSFPYRIGFVLEDATGFSVNGDVDVYSVFASSLPASHPSFSPQRHLETHPRWRSPPPNGGPVELFVGILSAGNHFAERMAVRKSWMQHKLVKSSDVIVRFFVALHGRREVNRMLVKEAEYFNDTVIVPYMDHYNLVILKTIAIYEYGDRIVAAKYIMKCDDDTFVRVDSIVDQVRNVRDDKSVYIGNMNYYHKPLREGKWAVTHDEWPEEEYPHYANGPGYVISADIASFIVSEFEKQRLRLFRMEDVSVGMWVEEFGRSRAVVYRHSQLFVQFGCLEGFHTAHYQSPRQMLCLWDNLMAHDDLPLCCDAK